MFPTRGTSSTLYVSILETPQICTLHFMMNKVIVSINSLHFFSIMVQSPLMVAELHATPLRTLIRNHHNCTDHVSPNLQRYRRTVFLQHRRTISPSRRHVFAKNRRTVFLQYCRTISPNCRHIFRQKSPNKSSPNRRTCLL